MKLLFSDEPIEMSSNMIFLAGPTSRTNDFDKSWRKDAVKILENLGFDGTVCIPEFKHKRPFTDNHWDNQVEWEWQLLDNCSRIIFWVPRSDELPGFTTNLEFGWYLARRPDNVIFGYPSTATKMQWMTKKYEQITSKLPCITLEETIKEALKIT